MSEETAPALAGTSGAVKAGPRKVGKLQTEAKCFYGTSSCFGVENQF